MQEQTTKKGTSTKPRISKGIQDVGVSAPVPPTADALREAHMNLVRAEQNLYALIQANPADSALLGAQPGFAHSAAHAGQAGFQAPGFESVFGQPAAANGFPGIGNAMVPDFSASGNVPAMGSPWSASTAGPSGGPVTGPTSSWAGSAFAPGAQGQTGIGRALACDIIDEGEQLVCQLELPGVGSDQVEVLCFGSVVTLTAFREPEGEISNLVQSERATSTQQRIIRLPSQVQPSGATATLSNGVLTVVLPKLYPTEGPRLVEITD